MPLTKKQKAFLVGGGVASVLGTCLVWSKAHAEKQALVKGKIIDEDTGEPIPGVKITINSYQTTTLIDGTFEIVVPVGTYTLSASLINYETKNMTVMVPEEGIDLGQITLKRTSQPKRMPASIKFDYLEYNLNKYFKYETWYCSPISCIPHPPCLFGEWRIKAVEYKDENATEKGPNEIHIRLQVLDDGNPVPDCPVEIWTSTEDQYGTPLIGDISWGGIGAFYYPADTPLTLKTDNEGKIVLRFKFSIKEIMLLSINPVYIYNSLTGWRGTIKDFGAYACPPYGFEWGPPTTRTLPHAIYADIPFAKQIYSLARVYVNVRVW